jgi:hypothetical protein
MAELTRQSEATILASIHLPTGKTENLEISTGMDQQEIDQRVAATVKLARKLDGNEDGAGLLASIISQLIDASEAQETKEHTMKEVERELRNTESEAPGRSSIAAACGVLISLSDGAPVPRSAIRRAAQELAAYAANIGIPGPQFVISEARRGRDE